VRALDRFDAFQQAHRRLGFCCAVARKFRDDSGGYLAAIIAYYAFVSLFPLLLLATTVLGFVLAGDTGLQQSLLHSALKDIPVVGGELTTPKRIGGGVVGVVVGLAGATYGALGVSQAIQFAMNTAWNVPLLDRPSAWQTLRRAVLLVIAAGLAVAASGTLSALAASTASTLGGVTRVMAAVLSLLVNTTVLTYIFLVATVRQLQARDVLPGAFSAAVAWQVLQGFGVTYVDHVVRHASSTNGVFAVVLGLLAFLHLAATTVIVCVEIDAVRLDRLFPRSLLSRSGRTLAPGDRRALEEEAGTERGSDDESIGVTFTPDESGPSS
jgi:membrane protein